VVLLAVLDTEDGEDNDPEGYECASENAKPDHGSITEVSENRESRLH
jgi:hypothetical protein